MKRYLFLLIAFLASCTQAPSPQVASRLPVMETGALPQMRSFSARRPQGALRPNGEIVQDFLDLSFVMESGRTLPRLTRFDGPISVRLTGARSPQTAADLRALLSRLRGEAGIDIFMSGGQDARITVQAIPRATLRRAVPNAACFVVPRVSSWDAYLSSRSTGLIDWTTLQSRDRAAIFIPADAPPQEIRDCLHEELAQALGPLNDLYRLPDSVFNDDNIHAVLTPFDMLILRAYYAPELQNGMSRGEVAARLPGIIARLNPAGARRAGQRPARTPRAWISAMETALSSGGSVASRQAAAQRAVNLARAHHWGGNRDGFANYAYGRLQVGHNPTRALAAFQDAHQRFQSAPETQIHSAYSAVQLAAFALSAGDAAQVLTLVDRAIPIATAYQNASLLATLKMFRAEAYALQGNMSAASRERLDSLGWARYGFGNEQNVAARLREIAQLSPRQ